MGNAQAATSSAGPPLTQDLRNSYKSLKEDIIKMNAAAEEAEANGDASGAKFKMMLLGDMNDKIKEMETTHPALTQAPPPQAGVLTPSANPTNAGYPNMRSGLKNIEMTQAAAQQAYMTLMQQHTATIGAAPMSFTQQQALQYDKEKFTNTGMDAEVKDLQEKYQLQDRHALLLNDNLKLRNNTFEEDLWHMDEILGRCNNAAQRADLLNMNVRWMVEGKFCGAYSPNPAVIKAAKKFNLDPPASCKLAHALESREDAETDINRINKHLERSNKPSSLVMMFLKTLKEGGNIDENYRAVAVGSWLHKQETSRAGSDNNNSRGGKGGGGKDSHYSRDNKDSRGGGGGRSRSR